ncbi:LOW QUALITY PROTEIN: hypothetical protein PHMEG_0008438 [Phytophthora megakarya]|uniref:Uncharacterized protein n=1 Tax=Phytophthora megakarya TaxID=4795 RepID=A0A225WIQ9_9STRA|nr:LOW QUALITY PROTEIN: hypothetical protein PHMEG_0008438 [Phytophthora megakarya]
MRPQKVRLNFSELTAPDKPSAQEEPSIHRELCSYIPTLIQLVHHNHRLRSGSEPKVPSATSQVIRHSPGDSGATPLAVLRGAELDLGNVLVLKLQYRTIWLSPERTPKFRPHRSDDHPSSGRADDSGTRLDEDLPAPNAVGSRELATVSSPRPAAPPASSGDTCTRPSGTPDTLVVGPNTASAVEQSIVLLASIGNADTNPVSALTTRSAEQPVAATIGSRGDRPNDPEVSGTKRDAETFAETPFYCRRFPVIAPRLRSLSTPLSKYASTCSSASMDESGTWCHATSGPVLPRPASLADDELAPGEEEAIRHLRKIASPGEALDRQLPE